MRRVGFGARPGLYLRALALPTLLTLASEAHSQSGPPPPGKPVQGPSGAEPKTPAGTTAADSEIVVTAKRPEILDGVDRQTYFVADDPDAKTGMAIDLLRKLPAVQVSPFGGVTLRGDSRVNILIDGKRPTNGNQALQSLSGSEIAHIEVMTNPSAEFAAEGAAGIINIVTKRRTPLGLTGSFNARISSRDRQVVSALANLSNGRYSAKAVLNAQHTSLPGSVATTYYQPVRANQVDRIRGDNRNARVDVTLKATTTGQGALSVQLVAFEGKRRTSDSFVYESDLESYTGKTLSTNRFYNRVIGGLYETKLSSEKISLSIDARHEVSGAPYRSATTIDASSGGVGTNIQQLDLAGRFDNVKSDLSWNISSERLLKSGFEVDRSTTSSRNVSYESGLLPGSDLLSLNFRFRGAQTLSKGYITWQQEVGGWTLLGGLRIENQDLALASDGDNVRISSADLYPSIHLSHSVGENANIKANYSRRVSRPDIVEYNPGIRSQSSNVIEKGNPNLRSSNIDSFEAQYVFNRGSLHYEVGLYYKHSDNVLGRLSTLSPLGQITIIPINRGKSDAVGISAALRQSLFKGIKYSLDFNVAYVRQPSLLYVYKDYLRYNANATIDYKRPLTRKGGSDNYQVQLTYSGRTFDLQGYTDPSYRIDATWSRTLSKDLDLTLTATDITKGQRSRTFIMSPGIRYSVLRKPISRSLQLGIAYRFKSSGF